MSSNQIFCKEPPNAQPNLPTNASTVSDRNNCEIVFPFGPYVKFILMVILDFRFSEKKDITCIFIIIKYGSTLRLVC
jgi:hypothetical protein